MIELARLASFLAFLALGVRITRLREPAARREAVNTLLAYVLVLSGTVGLTQHNDWPFANYMLAVGIPRLESPNCGFEFFGADESSREWRVDPAAWAPVSDWTLQLWFMRYFERLTPAQETRVLAFLADRAEATRQGLARGLWVGNDRRLGPMLTAPYWWLLPRPTDTAPSPYRRLRIYRTCWRPAELLQSPDSRQRTLLAEWAR